MTKLEMDTLTEVATDVKWLKAVLKDDITWKKNIGEHLEVLTSCVHTNTIFRKVSTWVVCILFMAIMSLVAKIIFGVNI